MGTANEPAYLIEDTQELFSAVDTKIKNISSPTIGKDAMVPHVVTPFSSMKLLKSALRVVAPNF